MLIYAYRSKFNYLELSCRLCPGNMIIKSSVAVKDLLSKTEANQYPHEYANIPTSGIKSDRESSSQTMCSNDATG